MNGKITLEQLVNIAGKIKKGVETEYKVPDEIDGLRNGQFTYLICKIIANYKPPLEIRSVRTAPKPSGTPINQNIYKSKYIELAHNLVKFVDKYGELPNHLNFEGKQITKQMYQYMFAKVLDYYYWNKTLPRYVYVNSASLIKPEPKPEPKSYAEEIYDYFCQVFNCKPTCFDDCLEEVSGNGYGYYYDDQYSNKQSIDRMKNHKGVNCVDSAHVFYNLAIYFIAKGKYKKVQCIHVMCRGGDGHVRLRIQLPNGDYFYRDPASVLDGNGIESNWCMNGDVVSYDPYWFMTNVNR